MKLLMTADAVGGVWQYATDLARALAPHGVETVIAVLGPGHGTGSAHSRHPRESGDPASFPSGESSGTPAFAGVTGEGPIEVVETNLPLDWLSPGPAPVLAAGEAIAALARDLGADLVHLNSPALAARARFAQPVVAVAHGCVATWWEAARAAPLAPEYAWHEGLMREGLLAADAAVAPTRAYAAAVQRRYALPRAPRAVHNGRAQLVLPSAPQAAWAFTAGRLWDEVKNTPVLDRVAALTPIRAAGPVTAPHGETVATEHLDLLGTLDPEALGRELAGRPVFVSAARFEPFGLAVLEAAQAGCPLVLSDIATFRELWDGAALFVSGEDPQDWADAIGQARARRDALGPAARARAARYTPAATAAAMARIYTCLLTTSSARAELVEAQDGSTQAGAGARPSTNSGRTKLGSTVGAQAA